MLGEAAPRHVNPVLWPDHPATPDDGSPQDYRGQFSLSVVEEPMIKRDTPKDTPFTMQGTTTAAPRIRRDHLHSESDTHRVK